MRIKPCKFRFINAEEYIIPNVNDNIDAFRKNLEFIDSRKIKSNFQTIYIKNNIWNFYIFNNFNQEFISYLGQKLLEGALSYEDIIDCINFSANQRHKKVSLVLKFLIDNFEKIYKPTRKKESIDLSNYLNIIPCEDNLEEIYELINEIINLQKQKYHKTFIFPIKKWIHH